MNPLAVNLWLIGLSAGYVFGGMHGAAWGVAGTATFTFILSVLPKSNRW